jgi:transcriptional regulator GlxA family with amidase domain
VIEANAEIGQHAGPERLCAQNLGRKTVRYGAENRVCAAERFLKSGGTQRAIVAVQSGFKIPAQLLLDNGG